MSSWSVGIQIIAVASTVWLTSFSHCFRWVPSQTHFFLIYCRRRDRIKALYWEGSCFVLLYKRLESGVLQWPHTADEVRELTQQQYRWLTEGLQVDQPKAHRTDTGLIVI